MIGDGNNAVTIGLTDLALERMESQVWGAGMCSPGRAAPDVLLWQYLRMLEARAERCMACEQPVGAQHLEICVVDGRSGREREAGVPREPVLAGSWTIPAEA